MKPTRTPHTESSPIRSRVTARGLAVAIAVLAMAATAVVGSAATAAPVVASVGTDSGSRERAFAAASAEHGVPQVVLEGVSYAQTRWDFRTGHSTSGGYGPMHLVDASLGERDVLRGLGTGASTPTSATVPAADTLGRAASLVGVTREVLRADELANIRGGAALLATTQRDLGLPTGTESDPGAWYAAVADASGSVRREAAVTFADDVYRVIGNGAARHTVDGKDVSLLPTKVTPQRALVGRLELVGGQRDRRVDCPPGLDCEWIPAPYEDFGGDYGNHDLAHRPGSPEITNIVIHNTEATYDTTLRLVTDPHYVSWQYSLRSSDGHIAQHLDPKDVGWHAGNWYVNSHSIGLEHEGFAAEGAAWFSEPMYRTSARLVRHLAAKYDVPLDRQHVIGHDQIPGVTRNHVAGMHWDPGPYWDWEHYFDLLGAPLTARKGTTSDEIVRILPGFTTNVQPLVSCETGGVECTPQGTNFVYLRTEPRPDAPLIRDVGLRSSGAPSTTHVSDIGARATAGVEYAVAGRQGDWTAIWFNGEKGWFPNPSGHPTAINVAGSYVVPKPGVASVPVYGRAYPEPSAYPAGIPVQALAPLQYGFNAGQRYAVGDLAVPTNYYRAVTYSLDTPNDHLDVVGQDRYYQISFGHRFAFVRAADVDVVTAK